MKRDLPWRYRQRLYLDPRQVQVDQLPNTLHRADLEMRRQAMAQLFGVAIGAGSEHERSRIQECVIVQCRNQNSVLTRLQLQLDGVLFEHHR
ncbi:hypothetical protein D3C77_588110 [compost metagenome]